MLLECGLCWLPAREKDVKSRRRLGERFLPFVWKGRTIESALDAPVLCLISWLTQPANSPPPLVLVNSQIIKALRFVSDMRKKFDKSLEVDQARRAELVPKIERLSVGEGSGVVEAQFKQLFAERKGSEEVMSGLGSAKSRVKVEKVRASEE